MYLMLLNDFNDMFDTVLSFCVRRDFLFKVREMLSVI